MRATDGDAADAALGRPNRRLAVQHDAIFLAVYALYGYQVCPFLEQLSLAQLMAPAALAAAARLALRELWTRAMVHASPPARVSRLFWGDLTLYLISGLALAALNFAVYGFPPDSGVKIVLAHGALGFYIALDLAFDRERRLADALRARRQAFPIGARFLPYQTKFVVFSMLNIAFVGGVVVLVVLKDLIWFAGTPMDPKTAQIVIMAELVFILGILGGYIFRAVRQYSRKLDRSLDAENRALSQVRDGDLGAAVAVVSNDEFGRMADLTNHMIARLKGSVAEVERSRDAIIMALTGLAAKRDNETGLHLQRSQAYLRLIAEALSRDPAYAPLLTREAIDLLAEAAPLHDIGKVGVPDAILQKPGRLDADEFEIMKTHAAIGAEALAEADMALGGSPFLAAAREIALTHHEKWDGSGYPRGLRGAAIPLSGRLMAVADVYDALRSARVYKPGFSREKARAIIEQGAGAHFDPAVVAAFLSVEPQIAALADAMADAGRDAAA